jgi:hypothetical protein
VKVSLQPDSRYSVVCPTCAARFQPGLYSKGLNNFQCPVCGELLERRTPYPILRFIASELAATALVYRVGYRDSGLIFGSILGTVVLFFVFSRLMYHISPPAAQRKIPAGESGLSLTGGHGPKSNKRLPPERTER